MGYQLLRSLFFLLPPEWAHRVVLQALAITPRVCFPAPPAPPPLSAMGLTFPHRIGLAAGFDKSGQFVQSLEKLHFSFIEVGTVTPLPQAGNPKPRLFRLPAQRALINRMGFNNEGVERLAARLSAHTRRGVLGINIGKNKTTPLDQAAQDYQRCFEAVYALADYVTVNISSPNTQQLRELQQSDFLETLLITLTQTQQRLANAQQRWVPLVIKCSPDETPDTLKRLADLALKYKIAGIIATNTTTQRPGLSGVQHGLEIGGLSGSPLGPLATQSLLILKQAVGNAVTLIASGGIEDESTAQEKFSAGATLLQLYTGLIYQGPGLVRRLARISP